MLHGLELLEGQGHVADAEQCDRLGIPHCDFRSMSHRRLVALAGNAMCVPCVGAVCLWVFSHLEVLQHRAPAASPPSMPRELSFCSPAQVKGARHQAAAAGPVVPQYAEMATLFVDVGVGESLAHLVLENDSGDFEAKKTL